jgi:hypothetical protein
MCRISFVKVLSIDDFKPASFARDWNWCKPFREVYGIPNTCSVIGAFHKGK